MRQGGWELKTEKKNIKVSILLSLVVSICFVALLFMFNIVGYSPLLTPYIKTYFFKIIKKEEKSELNINIALGLSSLINKTEDAEIFEYDITKYFRVVLCILVLFIIYIYLIYMIISIYFHKHFRIDKDIINYLNRCFF